MPLIMAGSYLLNIRSSSCYLWQVKTLPSISKIHPRGQYSPIENYCSQEVSLHLLISVSTHIIFWISVIATLSSIIPVKPFILLPWNPAEQNSCVKPGYPLIHCILTTDLSFYNIKLDFWSRWCVFHMKGHPSPPTSTQK